MLSFPKLTPSPVASDRDSEYSTVIADRKRRTNLRARKLLATISVFMLAGCVSPPVSPTKEVLNSLVGKTVLEAQKKFPNLVTPLYDLSQAILNIPPSYGVGMGSGNWVIVNACAAGKPSIGDIAVGIIPADSASLAIRDNAKSGQYRHLMGECGS
jgi:hypothetical protein